MKKGRSLKFDEIMDIYDELFPKGQWVRLDPVLSTVTPEAVAERIREAIRLSEQLIWKRPSRK